jgi:hypothetical protein
VTNLPRFSTYQISEISDAAHDAAGRIELPQLKAV